MLIGDDFQFHPVRFQRLTGQLGRHDGFARREATGRIGQDFDVIFQQQREQVRVGVTGACHGVAAHGHRGQLGARSHECRAQPGQTRRPAGPHDEA